MNNIEFEEMSERHLTEVLAIYNYYVKNTTATFHAHEITAEEMREIVFFQTEKYRSFAIRQDGELCGYVILTQYKKREAYDTTAEVTIYLRPGSVGRGIGRQALAFIEAFAGERRFHSLVAIICGENSQSIGLFAHSGYEKCAHYREVGQKFGQYLDIVCYQKILSD